MGDSRLVNRNIVAGRGRTCMRLEPELWDALAEVAAREGQGLSSLVRQIEAKGHDGGRTSAVRVFLIQYFRDLATQVEHEGANGAFRTMALHQSDTQPLRRPFEHKRRDPGASGSSNAAPKGPPMFTTILLATGCTDQSANVAEHDEPEDDTPPAHIGPPRAKAPMPPLSGQCCYPIGEPRTSEFHYCAGPVAHPGANYCLEHKRLCRRDIAA